MPRAQVSKFPPVFPIFPTQVKWFPGSCTANSASSCYWYGNDAHTKR